MDEWNRKQSHQADADSYERDEADHDGKHRREQEASRKQKLDDALDLGLEESFPGSDPVSVVQPQAGPYDKPKSTPKSE
jgi:hypothetical protein